MQRQFLETSSISSSCGVLPLHQKSDDAFHNPYCGWDPLAEAVKESDAHTNRYLELPTSNWLEKTVSRTLPIAMSATYNWGKHQYQVSHIYLDNQVIVSDLSVQRLLYLFFFN